MNYFHIYVNHKYIKTAKTTKEIWDIMKSAKFLWPEANTIEIITMGNGDDSMVWRK